MREYANFARTVRLLASFPFERKDPARFYVPLAEDTVHLMQLWSQPPTDDYHPIVVDVGAGPGYFSQVFSQHGYRYISVDPQAGDFSQPEYIAAEHDARVTSEKRTIEPTHVRSSGYELPFADNSCDIVLSSNVAEHVEFPWTMGREMLRVLKPGGVLFYSYTVWFGPFGGHEMGLWHYLGGKYAANRYTRIHGSPPKNLFGTSLFRVDARDGIRWSREINSTGEYTVHRVFPRYHPWWAWWIVRIPVLREWGTSNLMMVIEKKSQSNGEEESHSHKNLPSL